MEKGQIKEVFVKYGETRPTPKEFEIDRIEIGITRDLKPGEDAEEVIEDELDKLITFVKAYMRGDM
jgi:hypothetical protein